MTEVHSCSGCGTRPVTVGSDTYCGDCRAGGRDRLVPFPCRHCGATEGYRPTGRCGRCNWFAATQPCSCRDCFAWGVMRTEKWLCKACLGWRESYPILGKCGVCDAERHLGRGGFCRLCWRIASDAREATKRERPYRPLDVVGANRNGQQLFFANMVRRARRSATTPDHVPSHPVRPRARRSVPRQLELFDPPRTWMDRHGMPEPPRALTALLDERARDLAAGHGWSATQTKRVRLGLRVALGLEAPPRNRVRASTVLRLPSLGLGGGVALVLMVLAEADMLDDDRVPAIVSWFERETADLPPSIAKELGEWFDVQRNGSARTPRCRPRTESTTRLHTRWMLPAVRAWSADGHHSLREISKEDVLLALPPGGNERVLAAKALRTLFSVLKARGLVFVNPTAAIPTGRHERRQPLPLDVQVLRASLDSGDPVRAALTALVAFHGLRAGELRGLKLTDASSGHLYVSTRRIVLADPVRVRLSSYLDYRNAKWPSTANPHFFVNHLTACRTDPVGSRWLSLKLGMPAQLIREDRILDEALATEGDLRRLCDLFGIGIDAASRYSVGVDPASIEDPRTARRIRSE